jgi:hypothetical protein
MPTSLSELSVPSLERLLIKKRTQLVRLARRRTKLQGQLAKVERQIGRIGGHNGDQTRVKRKVRRRPRNARRLTDVVVEILKKNKSGFSLDQLKNKILASGYKSHSAHFKNVIYQCLYANRKKIVRDEKSGTYRLT